MQYEVGNKLRQLAISDSEIGFFESIALRPNNSLQDTLRLLTLWFKFGAHEAIGIAMEDGFSRVSVDTWLEVIPQVRWATLPSSCS